VDLEERYRGYRIRPVSRQLPDGRWSVGVVLSRGTEGGASRARFDAPASDRYLLEAEALKAGINLGKNLIDRNRVEF